MTKLITTLDLFCGDSAGKPLTKAKFLWQTALYRIMADQNKLATIVAAGVVDDGETSGKGE